MFPIIWQRYFNTAMLAVIQTNLMFNITYKAAQTPSVSINIGVIGVSETAYIDFFLLIS